MKIFVFLLIFFLILNCSNNKGVNWCGDHPCINKKEKEAYFKKTMIVEIKQLKKEFYKDNSEIEKLLQQAQIDEKKRIITEKELIKQAKLEEKRRIYEEKELIKQAKLEEKRRIKEEKELIKQAKLEEKRRTKEEKELVEEIYMEEERIIENEKKVVSKKIVKDSKKASNKSLESHTTEKVIKIGLSEFDELVKKITIRNSSKPFPEINNTPN